MTVTPAELTKSSPRWSPRFATPRDPTRDTLALTTLAHLARLRRSRPYRWQWDVAEVAGELNDDATGFRYPVIVLAVPRRAGKTTLDLAAAMAIMDVVRDARCWYTANKRETAAKLFRDEWAPMVEPMSRLYRVRKSQGSEGIHKRRGSSRLQLFAPTADALHSTNADKVTVDEAWAFDIDEGEALEGGISPAQLTRPWRQLWIVSAGGTIESTWLDRWIEAGEARTPGVALFDFGADPAAPDYDPADPRVWARAHPTFGVGFPAAVLEHEYALAAARGDVAAFERPYLNVWPRPSKVTGPAGLELARWSAQARPRFKPEHVAALVLDISADRSHASLSIAGPCRDGIVVQVLEHRPGIAWITAKARALKAQYRVPLYADALVAASVVAELARARVTVDAVSASDHAKACGTFVDLLESGRLFHRSQAVLDDAVAGAARRPLGDAWLWSRSRSSVDISPLVSCTIAAWVTHARPRGGRPAVITAATPENRPPTRPAFAPGATKRPWNGWR